MHSATCLPACPVLLVFSFASACWGFCCCLCFRLWLPLFLLVVCVCSSAFSSLFCLMLLMLPFCLLVFANCCLCFSLCLLMFALVPLCFWLYSTLMLLVIACVFPCVSLCRCRSFLVWLPLCLLVFACDCLFVCLLVSLLFFVLASRLLSRFSSPSKISTQHARSWATAHCTIRYLQACCYYYCSMLSDARFTKMSHNHAQECQL